MIYPDISHHHPITDWGKVKRNCPFLISKATQGLTFVDPTLKTFISGCERNKIPYWLYVYLNKGNELSQTRHMVDVCKNLVGEHFIGYILDVEEGNNASNVKASMNYLATLGRKSMLYTGYKDYHLYKGIIAERPSTCAWWESRYGKNNGYYSSKYPCHSGVDLYQYTSNGTCPGISGRIDLNRIMKRGEDWYKTKNTVVKANTVVKTNYITEVIKKMPVLKRGSKGKAVKVWQTILGNVSVDGSFGPDTENKTKTYQKQNGLIVDGMVGQQTWTYALTHL